MFRGLYTAGWGMLSKGKSMDVVSNNLANVNTTGFKKDIVVFQSFPEVFAKRLNDTSTPTNPTGNMGSMTMGSEIGEIFTNYKQGQLQNTSSNLDMSIKDADRAFFTVGIKSADGEMTQYYTKDGGFKIDANGYLVNNDGNFILGEKGEIKIETENFAVSDEGEISIEGKVFDKLLMKQFIDTSALKKYGNNLVTADPEEPSEKFSGVVKQGFLEQSNVNSIREMIDMISILRSYETNQKVIAAIDGTMEKSVNELGTVR